MKFKFLILSLVAILAIGGTYSAFAASNIGNLDAGKTIVRSNEKEMENDNEKDDVSLDPTMVKPAINEENAKQIALKSLSNSTFKSIVLEDENGKLVYGVIVQAGDQSYDVKVDANTGELLKSEQDNDNENSGKNVENSEVEDDDSIESGDQVSDDAE